MENEAAWLAGIYEGEGSCGIYGPYGKRGMRVRLSLASTDEDVVRSVQRITAVGTISLRPLSQSNPKHKDQWVWAVQNPKEALIVCELVMPMLHKRRLAQMEPVAAWCRERIANPPKKDVTNRLRDEEGRFQPGTI